MNYTGNFVRHFGHGAEIPGIGADYFPLQLAIFIFQDHNSAAALCGVVDHE
jgi:hypothetical protein